MDPLNFSIIVAVVIIGICVAGILQARYAQKSQYHRLQYSYGKLKKVEFTYEEYESISHFFRNTVKNDQFYVDDITWNDIDMDRIFLMINNTNSSVGRDTLYKILRTPVADESILKERDRLIRYFDAHPDERTKIMQSFANIGYSKKISISDYMDNLVSLKPESNALHYLLNFCIVFSLVFTITINPILGIFMTLASFGTSIVMYYKLKANVESYFSCIRQLVAMVTTAKDIHKMQLPELEEYNHFFKKTADKFAKVTRNAFLLVSKNELSGSLGDIFFEYIRMFTHIDLIKFNRMLGHIDKNYQDILELMDQLGLLEAMISVGSFRTLLPYQSSPEFTQEPTLEIKDVYHLSLREPVSNSISESRPVLLTGSNASGKSTFLKSVAICSLLAQTIYTCPSEVYKAPFYRIYSSMALADDLEGGDSYYIVEIKSLKRIVDAAKIPGPRILCFIDEVLRGTNTVERIAASSEILKNLASENVMSFAATHDIELTHILEEQYANYHFTEDVVDNQIVFTYYIHSGRATSRNAIKLLEIIGYDKEIVSRAESRADAFLASGIWEG